MPVIEKIGRRDCVPVLHCRGTNYEVGFDIGRNFRSIIQNFVSHHSSLNDIYIPAYKTEEGRRSYDETLAAVTKNFPQYVKEIEGTADGAQVPFYKLFLLHMDDILPKSIESSGANNCAGCSTVCCNEPGQEILGHNEDALSETLNHFYFVSAHVVNDKPQGRWGVKEETFTSLCYAGTLPGFTMSYNHHGLVFSVNIVSPNVLLPGKTPRTFITRALLAAETFEGAQKMLRDSGVGAGDGVSINMTFLKQDGSRLFHNAEVGPPNKSNPKESALDILTASKGEHIFHCNRYLRLKVPEVTGMIIESSRHRHKAMESLPRPKNQQDVINILGDNSDEDFPIYRDKTDEDYVKTIATGIFNCVDRTWSIFTKNPKYNPPTIILPIILKNDKK